MSESQVNQADVDAFLSDSQTKLEEIGKIKLDEGTRAAIHEVKSKEPEPSQVEIPADPAFSPDNVTQSKVAFWRAETPDVGQVEVTDNEKTLYLKAVLNDTPLVWDIDVNGIQIRIRSRTLFETDLIFKTLYQDEQSGESVGPIDFNSRMQQYAASIQILAINDQDIEPFAVLSTALPASEYSNDLRNHTRKHIVGKSEPRWAMILAGLRIFTVKEHLCTNNVANRNFWKLADTV